MIDWARVDELRAEIGEDGFGEVVLLFMEEVESVLARMASAQPGHRPGDDLHFLKGCAWNLGFRQFGAMCQDRERRLAAGDTAAFQPAEIAECYIDSKANFLAALNPGAQAGAGKVA